MCIARKHIHYNLRLAKSKQEKELLPYIADYLHFKIFHLNNVEENEDTSEMV